MPQKFLSIKNLEKYQTNSKVNPPWFKIHRIMFGDPEFIKLTAAQRFLYIGLIHLAVESGNHIYNDATFIGQRLYMKCTEIDLKPLYRSGLLYTSNLSRTLSETEESRDRGEGDVAAKDDLKEEETEKNIVRSREQAAIFWTLYKPNPRKVGKGAIEKWFIKHQPTESEFNQIRERIYTLNNSVKWAEDGGKWIPAPMTWLNQERWKDDVPITQDIPQMHRSRPTGVVL